MRQATKRKHNDLGPATGPNYEGQPNVSELAGWRQLSPIRESSCFPGAGRRTTSLAQARLPVMKRLMMVYIILAATAIVVRNAVPAEAELHSGITADLIDDSELSWSSGSGSRSLLLQIRATCSAPIYGQTVCNSHPEDAAN